MAKQSKDSRLNLGEPLAGELADFCVAHYGAPAIEIIRAALSEFMRARLDDEPAMRKRYEAARKKRLSSVAPNVRVLPSGK